MDAAGVLRHELVARMPQGVAGVKLGAFVSQVQARVLHLAPGRAFLQVGQRGLCSGRDVRTIPVEIRIEASAAPTTRRYETRLRVTMRPLSAGVQPAGLRQRYSQLLLALRQTLLADDVERRTMPRFHTRFFVDVWPLSAPSAARRIEDVIRAVGLDFSTHGIAFETPRPFDEPYAYLEFHAPGWITQQALPAAIVSRTTGPGASYEYHAMFIETP